MSIRKIVFGFCAAALCGVLAAAQPQPSHAAAEGEKAARAAEEVRTEVRDTGNTPLTQEERNKIHMDRLEQQEKAESATQYVGDAALTAKVKAHLLAWEGLDSLEIKVVTVNGEVTLMGTVDDAAQIGLAAKAASEVNGVRHVNNQLVVK